MTKLIPDESKHVSRELSRFIRDYWENVKYDLMKKVVLLCTLGMSTSLLVSKMRKAAKELEIDCSIVAIGEYELKKYEKEADIIMLGPQVRYLFNRIVKRRIMLCNRENYIMTRIQKDIASGIKIMPVGCRIMVAFIAEKG